MSENGDLRWQWLPFDALSLESLYAMIQARFEVFAIEQNCVYQDLDGLDRSAWHLLAWDDRAAPSELAAYLRVLPAGAKYPQLSIGRVLTRPAYRGTGLGHILVRQALDYIAREWGPQQVLISAQAHLEDYYRRHGFETCSEPYLEDGIPHIEMTRGAT